MAGGNQVKNAEKAGETDNATNLADIRGQVQGRSGEFAARLAETNSRLDAQSNAAEVEKVSADDTPVATRMAEITSTIMEQAEVVENVDAQKAELDEALMNALDDVREQKEASEEMVKDTDTQEAELDEALKNALDDVREQKEASEEKKQDQTGGIANIAA